MMIDYPDWMLTRKSCTEKTQAASLELRRKQDRIYSEINLQKKTISNLNHEMQVSREKTRDLQTFFEDRIEELRRVDRSTGVPRPSSVTMELLNHQIDDLAQDNYIDLAMSTDILTRVGDQNLYSPGPSVESIYGMSNTDTRVGDQNLYDPGPGV